MALLRRDHGRLTEAEELFRRALELKCEVQGEDHPNTLRSPSGFQGRPHGPTTASTTRFVLKHERNLGQVGDLGRGASLAGRFLRSLRTTR